MTHDESPPPFSRGDRRKASASGIRVETWAFMARRTALQELCDEWLNAYAPPEVAIFRPSLPLVFCSKLFYPEMEDRYVWETGTQSQTELYFAIPVERWQATDRGERFVEHGIVTPFIFVNNHASAVAGRERFGFPKEVCDFNREWNPSEWSGDQLLWTMRAWSPTPMGLSLNPLLRAAGGTPRFGPEPPTIPAPGKADLLWMLRQVWAELQSHWARVGAAGTGYPLQSLLGLLGNGLEVNVFNFRQFADPSYEDVARYQDFVRFRMRINDVRLFERILGAQHLLISRSALRPIVKKLGLRVSASRSEAGEIVDVVDALVPTIADVDVDLVQLERLCFRQATGEWRLDDGTPLEPPVTAMPRFCPALGPSLGVEFMNVHASRPVPLDAKILLLPVGVEEATRAVEQCLPEGFPGEVRPLAAGDWAGIRLLASRSRSVDPRDAEERVWMDGSYVSVSVPVEVEHAGKRFLALFLLADFTDNGFLLHALRELALSPTHRGMFISQPSGWFSSSQPLVDVLRLRAQALGRTGEAAVVDERPVLDIFTRAPTPSAIDASALGEIWDYARGLRPMLSTGAIAGPTIRPYPISRRVVLTDIEESDLEPFVDIPRTDVEHVVLFHTTETFSFIEDLALPELPVGSGFPTQEESGRIRMGIATHAAQTVLNVAVRNLTILWEDASGPPGQEP